MSEDILKILESRRKTHGDFPTQSFVAQAIKAALEYGEKWHELNVVQKEAIQFIASKMSRIVSGNPNHKDSWQDIAGYAELVAKELK